MKHKLPPLPPYAPEFRPRWLGDPGGYSEAQMQAYAIKAVNDVLAGLEASMVAADLRINDMKNTGELRRCEDHAALVAQVQERHLDGSRNRHDSRSNYESWRLKW